MPRFFFDVRVGTIFAPDEEGIELDSLDTAERKAAKTAAELGRDRLSMDDSREVTIDVRNEHRQRVLTVTLSLEVNRVQPESQPAHA